METRAAGLMSALLGALYLLVAHQAAADEPDVVERLKEQDLDIVTTVVAEDVLEDARGQANATWVTINDMDVSAEMTGNAVTASPTGHNSISDAAFQNAAGLTTVIQNSGNHVVIQDVTVINITLQ
jgi:hypothetical protein